jgi:hypothetical protein
MSRASCATCIWSEPYWQSWEIRNRLGWAPIGSGSNKVAFSRRAVQDLVDLLLERKMRQWNILIALSPTFSRRESRN